ncbi:MAG: type IV secretion system DNA-binding domain-containing protein [Candidatus Paceibacterota bacterium]|jgi:CxxC-x17-CxxC domain-containing protein
MENEIPHNRDITYFGRTNFRSSNTIFGIKRKDRRQHMYILGKSGTGKSVLLSNLIVQNIQNGEGVCVVDPHGETVEEILHLIPDHRVKDVIYFNPADTDFHIGFNVIQLDDPKYKHLVASGLMGIFTKIWANAWSSRMEYILNNAILALLDTPGTTLLGIPRLLVDKDYRQMIIGNLKDPVVKAFWVHEYEQWREQFRNEAIAPIQNKVGQFLSTSIIRNVVGQPKSTIDIFEIMNSGKIFLVNVSKGRIGEDNSALLGGMIITKIQLAAMERVRIPEDERKDFYLYVDEFQNFATDSFANILSEARKYRLNLTVAHQYTAQLENKDGSKVRDAVFGNVGTMIIFRVGGDDAEFLEKEFEPEFTALDLVNLPNYHVYIKLMIDGVTSRPFSAVTLPPIKVDLSLGVREKIIESSRKLYTRPRKEVEDEILRWSGMLQVGEGEAKYKADCSNCKKSTMVPFEPQEGRPVYCKECMFKIKSGELKPESGFVASRSSRQEEKVSTAPLAALGIEFGVTDKNFRVSKNQEQMKNSLPINMDTSHHNGHLKNNSGDNHQNKNPNNHFVKGERKHTGPSPLLKGLLEKIGVNGNKEKISDGKVEAVEIKKEVPVPISLASLKIKTNEEIKKDFVIPAKEASEEKKASLKDLLEKTANHNIPKESPLGEKEPEPKGLSFGNDIQVNEEEAQVASQPEPEVKIPEPEVISPVPQKEDIPAPQPEPEVKKEEPEIKSDADSWQKRKIKKEVPEDVLRKVLE